MAEADRAAVLLGNTITFMTLMLMCVIARLWHRGNKKVLSMSDLCIALAALSGVSQSALQITTVTKWGYGQHAADLPKDIATSRTPAMLLFINQVLFKFTTPMTKLSLCFVYADLFRSADSKLIRWSRYVNYATAFIISTFYFAICIAATFQCLPVRKSWLPKTPGSCVDLRIIRFTTACMNIFTSFLVIGLPLPVLFSMKRRGSEVKQIIFLVLLGLIHNACAIGRLIMMCIPSLQQTKDAQWETIPGTTASMIEMHVGIIAASLVVMRTVFRQMRNLLTGRSRTKSTDAATTRNPSEYVNMSGSKKGQQRKQYLDTIDMELEGRSVSTEHILQPKYSQKTL